jgi:hypothetical protein
VEGLADHERDDERPRGLRLPLRTVELCADFYKGYMVLEEDMTMSLEEFSRKYAREDGEPEYAS